MYNETAFNFERLYPLLASSMWPNIKLLAFDFDGVVGHTEPVQMRAFKEVAETHGKAPAIVIEFQALVKEMIGKPEATILSILKERHDIPYSVDDLLTIRGDTYLARTKETVGPNPYAKAILEQAQRDDKHCIVLSNGRSHILGALNDHWLLDHHFAEMQSVDVRPIPDKTAYLLARAKQEGLAPNQILILEDSVGTIQKAEKAGINAVYFRHELNDHDFEPKSKFAIPCINPPKNTMSPDAPFVRSNAYIHKPRGYAL